MAYLLDTNVLIEAKNHYYSFDICPAFWEWIELQYAAGKVFSVAKVHDELLPIEDELTEWARDRPAGFFLAEDDDVIDSYRATVQWAGGAGYSTKDLADFLSKADPYLVAEGHAHGHTVVTHELVKPTRAKVKIPVACSALGVPCISPYEMLRIEGVRFVLP